MDAAGRQPSQMDACWAAFPIAVIEQLDHHAIEVSPPPAWRLRLSAFHRPCKSHARCSFPPLRPGAEHTPERTPLPASAAVCAHPGMVYPPEARPLVCELVQAVVRAGVILQCLSVCDGVLPRLPHLRQADRPCDQRVPLWGAIRHWGHNPLG